MCGIAGIVVSPDGRVDRSVLERMTRTLVRRGPDDEGYYVDGACGLGHRRLSIIDLDAGRQPLETEDGAVQIIANGEIYNFRELRRELERHGYRFRTNSDCEVIAHGYAAWGEGVIERLDGMFALAIWDTKERRLLLARDRMGKKPLYYAFVGANKNQLIFGSELKALAVHPEMDHSVGPAALASYLTYECVPEGEAIYEAARKLLPGNYLVFDRERQQTRIEEYWSMRFCDVPGVPDMTRWSETAICDELRARIRRATEARLISDVPLGVFLSGGIDSSIVTAAMAQIVSGEEIETFAITFEDESFDEGPHARRVAEHLGTDHHEERLSPRTMIDILPEVADFMCEPIGDASIIPTYLLSRFARKSVTVALGGDGGDELFLGYPTFQAERVAQSLDRILDSGASAQVGQAVLRAAQLLPVSRKNFSLDFKLKRFAQGLGFAPDLRHQAWMGSFTPAQLDALFDPEFKSRALAQNPYAIVSSFRDRVEFRDEWDALSYQYARLYLTGCVLVKVDRASMANSLEVRAPLLDTKVVELANAIPGSLKLRGMTTKYVLKQAARGWLPPEIIDRPKKGFGIPMGEWLRGPLRPMMYELLAPHRLLSTGFFNHKEISRLLDEHDKGLADHRKPLWTLMAFMLWYERYGPRGRFTQVRDEPPADASSVVYQFEAGS